MTWWGSKFLRLMALRSCQLETSYILNRWFVRFAFYVTKIAIRFNNKWFCFLIHATSSTFNLLHSGEKTSLTLTKGFNSIRIWHITPRNEQTSQRSQTRYLWEWICKKKWNHAAPNSFLLAFWYDMKSNTCKWHVIFLSLSMMRLYSQWYMLFSYQIISRRCSESDTLTSVVFNSLETY